MNPINAVWRRVRHRSGRARGHLGPLSPLTRRILLLNFAALALLLGGILYLDQVRSGLIEARLDSLKSQTEMVAGALGEAATREIGAGEATGGIDVAVAQSILRRLLEPADARGRLFGADGGLIADTRDFLRDDRIAAEDLAPPDGWARLTGFLRRVHEWLITLPSAAEERPPYVEPPDQSARDYAEVAAALGGGQGARIRQGPDGSLILTVALPVQRFRRVMGAVMLSLETSQIEEVARQERLALFEVFGIALAATGILSLLLARTIARPVRQLAEAADKVRHGGQRATPVKIPDLTGRGDEIGELSGALREMTAALYRRIDEIEAFAADVAHEIKNPLSSLRSAVETLSNTTDAEKQRRLLDIIAEDVGRIDRLISDISYASRIDAELSREVLEPVDLDALATGLVDHYRTARAGRGIQVALERTPEDADYTVNGLETRLGQVLRNLLDNALTFSPVAGRVVVSLTRERDAVVIAVADDGPGIPEDKLDAIFDRFYSERPDDEAFGTHSGLGLAISRKIVEAHRGTIHAENRSEGGARFVIRLPAE